MDLPQIDPTLRLDAAYAPPNAAPTRTGSASNDKFSHLLNAQLRERAPERKADTGADADPASSPAPEADAAGQQAPLPPEHHDDDAIELVCVDDDDGDLDIQTGPQVPQLADASALPIVVPVMLPLAPLPETPVLTGLDFSLDAQLRGAGMAIAALDLPAQPAGAPVAAEPDGASPTIPNAPVGDDDEDLTDFAAVPPPKGPAVAAQSAPAVEIAPRQGAVEQPGPLPAKAGPSAQIAAAPQPVAPATSSEPVATAVAVAAPVDAKTTVKPAARTNPIVTPTAEIDADGTDAASLDAMPAEVTLTVVNDRPPARPAAPPVAANQQTFLPADAAGPATPPEAASPSDSNRPATDLFATAMKAFEGDETVAEDDKPAAIAAQPTQTNNAPTPQAAPQPAPAAEATAAAAATNRPMVHPVVEQVVLHIAKAAADQADRIKIELRPIELGRIDVRMEIGPDGRVQAVFAADRPQTMELLQRDSRQLQSALQDAGLNVDSGSLSFDLRGNGSGAGSNSFANTFTPARGSYDVPPELVATSQVYAAPGSGAGRLDIRV